MMVPEPNLQSIAEARTHDASLAGFTAAVE
jgi:hypothetical protein